MAAKIYVAAVLKRSSPNCEAVPPSDAWKFL